jgi:Yip1 domain
MAPEDNFASQPAAAPAPESQNFFSRLIGIYFSPGETFQGIGHKPTFLLPLILLFVVSGITSYTMIDRITVSRFFGQRIEQAVASGRTTQEQASQQLEQMTKRESIIKASFPIIAIIMNVVTILIAAGIFKLYSMMMGADNQFSHLFSVTIWAFLAIAIVQSVLIVLLLYLKSPDDIDPQNLIGSNLNALLAMVVGKDGLPKFIMALARWIDLFGIWLIALLSIGYAAVSKRMKTSTAAVGLGGLYGLAALIGAAWAALFG